VIGLDGFPLVGVGDDLARMIVESAEKNGTPIRDGDILALSQKIVSKAEGRLARLSDVVPSEKAKKIAALTDKDARLVELVLHETRMILKAIPGFLIVKDKRGWICLNAGIDRSNVSSATDLYTLLPVNPDESAKRIHHEISRLTAKKIGVIICDTFSRPFRRGQTEFAIGISGVKAFKDYRGEKDLFGHVLHVKNVAIIDELACAAELLMGQGNEGVPVAIIRNLKRVELCDESSSSTKEIHLAMHEDFFEDAL